MGERSLKSLRKLALTLTMITLIFVTLFPPCVKADVQPTPEFVEPVKNWSFEEIGSSLSESQYWSTNHGGWREHRSDAYVDGEINVLDSQKVLIARTLGKTAEEEPTCDVNCDGVINVLDSLIVQVDRTNGEVPNRIHGNHSWYTSGGGDYQMWQWLDSDAVQAVAGQTVTFGFWFLPEFIPSGSESEPLGQATSTSGWFCGTELTYTPPSGKSVILRKVQLDVYVEGGGRGYYKITYQKAGEAETLLVPDQEVTNTVQETRTHDVFVWGEEGQSITVYFYIGRYQGSGMIWSRNHYMYYQVPEMSARAEIYYEYAGGSNTVYGTWATPTDIEWWNTYVTASLPVSTTSVKVIIHGKLDFKAWIDSISLVISILTPPFDTGKGTLTLGINIYEWHRTPGFDPDGIVRLVPALYAEASGDYKIRWIQLKIALLPNDGSSTQQDGFLNIYYCQQENSEDYEVDPAMQEEVQRENLETGANIIRYGTGIAIGLVFVAVTGGAGAATWPAIFKVFAATTSSYVVGSKLIGLLYAFRSDPNVKNAGPSPQPYYVLEKWNYPTVEATPDPFVESAAGQYSLDWTFRTASAETFEIQITATVNWGKVITDVGEYKLQDAGTYSSVTWITINA